MVLRFVVCFIIFLSLSSRSYAEELENVLNKVNSFLRDNNTLRGNFELRQGKQKSRGYFLFKKPNNFKMVFNYDKTIIFNGESLFVHFSNSKIVIEQDINKGRDFYLAMDTIDINYLKRHYNYTFKEDYGYLTYIKSLREKVYILEFNAKRWDYSFVKLFFYIRKDGLIVRSVGISNAGERFILSKKNVTLNTKIKDSEFALKTLEGIKIIKNPFTTGRIY